MSVVDQLARQASRFANDVQVSLRRARVEGERRLLQRQHRAALEDLGLRTYELDPGRRAARGAAGNRGRRHRPQADRARGQGAGDRPAAGRRGPERADTGDDAVDTAFPMVGRRVADRRRTPRRPAEQPRTGLGSQPSVFSAATDKRTPRAAVAWPDGGGTYHSEGCIVSYPHVRRVACRRLVSARSSGVRAKHDIQDNHRSEAPACHRCGLPLLADSEYCPFCERWLAEGTMTRLLGTRRSRRARPASAG